MENLLQKIPFLRPIICFASGIIVANVWGETITYNIILICFVAILLFRSINFKTKLVLYRIYTFLLSIFLVISGYVYSEFYNSKRASVEADYYYGTILEKPIRKENSFKSEIKLIQAVDSNEYYSINETVITYFEVDSCVHKLQPGDRILLFSKPVQIANSGNPYEFNYQKYLSQKRIYTQVYLQSKNWTYLPASSSKSILIHARLIREKLLSIYLENNISDEKFAILSALTLGYKDALDPEVKSVFSSAGAMHVLAVSGLHVGIIYLIINFMFGFMKRRKIGRSIFMVLAISALWIYALLTGLSPSVLRAATMFTFLVVGENLKRPSNIYNTLAASAFFLLLINPNLLFEVGFQLSYCAVIGIVFFHPKFYNLFQFKTWILDKIWSLFCVSLSAQLATFPFSIYYFNQFPTYAWLSNFVVIPAAFVFIFLGIAVLAFSPIPIISGLLGKITSFLLHLLYSFLSSFKHLPNYVITDIYITKEQLLLLLVILAFSMFFLTSKRAKYISNILFVACIFVSINIFQEFKTVHNKEIIIYNAGRTKLIHLIEGKKNYILSEEPINEKMEYIYKNVQLCKKLDPPIFLNLKETYQTSNLCVTPNFIVFHEQNIFHGKLSNNKPDFPIKLAICNSLTQTKNIRAETIITYNSHLKSSFKGSNIHFLKKDGAYSYAF